MSPVEIAMQHVARRTPWMHQARGPQALDCIGLLVVCFAAYGIQDRTDYDQKPRHGQLEKCVAEQFGPSIPKSEMRVGDVVCLAFPRVIKHVGILVESMHGGLSLVHTWNGGPRCVCETRVDDQWLKRIKFVHRMPEP